MPSPQKKHAAGRSKHRSKPLERAAGAAPSPRRRERAPPSPTREAGESWRGSGGSLASASRRHSPLAGPATDYSAVENRFMSHRRHSQEGDSRRHSQRHSQDGFRLVEGATQARPSDLIRRATGDSLGSGRLHDLHLLEKHSPRDPDGADGSCARVSEEPPAACGPASRRPTRTPPSTPSFTGVCVGGERAARLARQLRRAEERRLADLVASAPTEARTAAGRRAAGRSGGRGGRHGGFAHAAEAPPEGVERPHGAHSLSNQLMN